MKTLIFLIILSGLTFSQDYSKYSKSPLTLGELKTIALILPRVLEQQEIIASYEQENIALRKVIELDNNSIDILNLRVEGLEAIAEANKPDFLQEYTMIAIYIVVSFLVGLAVAL